MDEDKQDVMGEDDGVHTPDNPYCCDLDCWCHTDVGYHSTVQYPTYLNEDVELAYSFYEVDR
jgi:hypothetical protein